MLKKENKKRKKKGKIPKPRGCLALRLNNSFYYYLNNNNTFDPSSYSYQIRISTTLNIE